MSLISVIDTRKVYAMLVEVVTDPDISKAEIKCEIIKAAAILEKNLKRFYDEENRKTAIRRAAGLKAAETRRKNLDKTRVKK